MTPAAQSAPSYLHDESLWPVSVTMISGRALDSELIEHMEHVDALYAKREAFLTVTFLAFSARTTNQQRKMMADWLNATQAEMLAFNKGAVFVTGSMVFRFVLSGLMLLSPLPIPYEIYSDVSSSVPWLERQLLGNGLTAPDDLVVGLQGLERQFCGMV